VLDFYEDHLFPSTFFYAQGLGRYTFLRNGSPLVDPWPCRYHGVRQLRRWRNRSDPALRGRTPALHGGGHRHHRVRPGLFQRRWIRQARHDFREVCAAQHRAGLHRKIRRLVCHHHAADGGHSGHSGALAAWQAVCV
jgi:hypothetical protein